MMEISWRMAVLLVSTVCLEELGSKDFSNGCAPCLCEFR
jgi:hypothetical protein